VGLAVEVLFDVVGLDLQLLADVEQERLWHTVSRCGGQPGKRSRQS
jgi:hypothetical protein